MNEKLFKPLNEQITVVNIKKTNITESDFREASNDIIFNDSLTSLTKIVNRSIITEAEYKQTSFDIIYNNHIDSLLEQITKAKEMPLNEASLGSGRRFRKKLYKLKHKYDLTRDPIEKERLFQKIDELQRRMESAGFKSTLNYAETTEGMPEDKKLAQTAEDYFGTNDPVLKAKAMQEYIKRSDKLAKKGKPSQLSSMERARA